MASEANSGPTENVLFDRHEIHDVSGTFRDLGAAQLIEHVIQRREGLLADGGALVVRTGQFTGRSPRDKFIVRDDLTESSVDWGPVNQPMSREHFENIYSRAVAFLEGREVFVQDCLAGADPAYSLSVRVVTQLAWHALFAQQLLIHPDRDRAKSKSSDFTLLFVPGFQADPALDGTNSETCIILDFKRHVILIAGTSYAGELKKVIFTVLNYLLPAREALPMHCSANIGRNGEVALFFGLSGTGKTTLSADPERSLIGDDEHGWSDSGVFDFEGGCYAKVIRLSREGEPEIYATTRMFGTVLENVVVDPATRTIDLESAEITEHPRACYPIHFIPNHVPGGVAGHPAHIVFLTCDAYGIMPPLARLAPAQATHHFRAC